MSKRKSTPPPGESAEHAAVEAALLLNGRQLAFAHHYVRSGNARQAYEAAYGRKGSGSVQLANPLIKSEILRLQALVSQEIVFDRAWILDRMVKLAQIAMGELPLVAETLDEHGEVLTRTSVRGVMMSEARQILTQLGKVDEVGLFVERQQVEHDLNFASMTDDELHQYVIEIQAELEPPKTAGDSGGGKRGT